ncbi:MAG: aminotransferase class I/II-fold pyridoxal phosphate-dependent enzyme, partial [Elusimicrobia bacterium]|nr:aminotransferase class I/II-fold pyridoxal phosphate-dependent enzyme [Elusimicrobiota bacterium]
LPFVSEGEKCSLIPLALEEERVLVLRSLTKILAVPGLRLGYAVGHSQTISRLEKILPPWRINIFAQKLAERISEFDDYIQKTQDSIPLFFRGFTDNLKKLHSIKIFPSSCNFIFVKVAEKRLNASHAWDQLARRGILVRACNDFVGLEKDCFLRFAVKRPQENQILINALKEILGDGR